MSELINFSTKLEFIEMVNPLVSKYKCYIASENTLANNFYFTKAILDDMKKTVVSSPVVAGFINNEDGSLCGGHEDDRIIDKNGNTVITPKPIAVGFVSDSIKPWWELHDNKNFLTCFTYIWDDMYPGLKNLPNRDIWQSMQMNLDYNEEGKIKNVLKAELTALCILENVRPAFTGSTFEKFSNMNFSQDFKKDVNKLKKEYEAFQSKTKYSDLDFTIPEGVKEQAQKGLDLRKEYNRGGTSVGINMAKYLVSNTVIIPEKVKKINQYFLRHEKDNLSDDGQNGKPISNGYISWKLWTGDEGKIWSNKLVEQMNEKEKNKNFSEIGGSKEVFDKLSMNQLCASIRNALKDFKVVQGDGWCCNKYYLDDLKDDVVILEDSECTKYYSVPYVIDDKGNATLDMNSKQEMLQDYKPKTFSQKSVERFIAKDLLGTKDALKIDKSKESMSEAAWGDVNKSQLKKDCLEASNYKTICPDVFLQLSDGWEDGKEGSLGYPVMEKKGDTLVYNRYGLASAKTYAENNDKDVLAKVNSIYKKLGLDKEDSQNKTGGEKFKMKDFKAMYSKMKEEKSIFAFDDSIDEGSEGDNDSLALIDSETGVIYILENGEVTKLPYCTTDDNDDTFAVVEDKKEKMDNSMEMMNKIIKMAKVNKQKMSTELSAKDVEIGKAFSKISSLETGLIDAQNATKENANKLAEYDKQFKTQENEKNKQKMSELLSKKEFSVFGADEKTELINQSVTMKFSDFEDKIYSLFGKRIKDNIKFSNEGKASVNFIYTESTLPKGDSEEVDDIYSKIRKENKIE